MDKRQDTDFARGDDRRIWEQLCQVMADMVSGKPRGVFGAGLILKNADGRDAPFAHIDGVAASAATFLALGCDEVEMAEGAFFMIHNAWCFAAGNAEAMRKCAGWLDKIDTSICADYVKKTGKKEEEICALMAAETWMTAEEAKENGFIDRISEPKKVENRWNLDAYDRVPDALKAKNEPKPEPEKPGYDREGMERRLALIELG
jgi:enoyl-CoA hydratase/carnithine racemase